MIIIKGRGVGCIFSIWRYHRNPARSFIGVEGDIEGESKMKILMATTIAKQKFCVRYSKISKRAPLKKQKQEQKKKKKNPLRH